MNLIEELAARAFNATYSFINSSSGKRRRVAIVLAYASYYATMGALLALYAFAIMVVFSTILMVYFPQLYFELNEAQCIPPIHHLFMFGAISPAAVIIKSWKPIVQEIYREYKGVFEEAGILQEFVAVLDRISSTLAAVERCRPPSIIVRTLVYDDLKMLDDFAKEYRGHVGEVMDYVCEELRSLLYEILGGE